MSCFLPEFTGSVNSIFCAGAWLAHCVSLYNSLNRFICKSLVELYLYVIHKLFPKEQRSTGGFSSPQNVPISWLEHLGPSRISKNDPKQDGNTNDSSLSLTLYPSCANSTQVHCLPLPQMAGLFELLINPEVSFPCRMTGSSVETKRRTNKSENKLEKRDLVSKTTTTTSSDNNNNKLFIFFKFVHYYL